MDSKRWEPATSKEKSQEQPLLPKAYTMDIEQSINKAVKKVDFKAVAVVMVVALEKSNLTSQI